MSIPTLTVGASAADLTPYMESLSVDWGWNETLQWRGTFVHHTSGIATQPSPLRPPGTGGTFADLILPHDHTPDRYLTLTVDHAGEEVTFPRLLAGDPDFDGYALNWGGTDLSPVLEQDSQPMADILFDGGGVQRRAHAAVAEICSEFGVKSRCDFEDYRIRELRRASGTPMGWISQIAQVYQAGRSWAGTGTLVLAPAVFDADASYYDWQFEERLQVKSLAIRSNADSVRNSFVVARLEPQSNLLGEQELRGGAAVGRTGNITLSRPVRFIQPVGQPTNGVLEAMTCYDESGAVTAFSALPLHPMRALKGPIARVEFTFRPTITTAPVSLGFYVAIYGGTTTTSQAFAYSVSSAESIAEIGERKEIRPLEVTMPVDAADAQAMANAVLEERIRRTWEMTLVTPFANPLIRPGDRLKVVDWLTGGSRIWFVSRCSWSWSRGASPSLTITGHRPWL